MSMICGEREHGVPWQRWETSLHHCIEEAGSEFPLQSGVGCLGVGQRERGRKEEREEREKEVGSNHRAHFM